MAISNKDNDIASEALQDYFNDIFSTEDLSALVVDEHPEEIERNGRSSQESNGASKNAVASESGAQDSKRQAHITNDPAKYELTKESTTKEKLTQEKALRAKQEESERFNESVSAGANETNDEFSGASASNIQRTTIQHSDTQPPVSRANNQTRAFTRNDAQTPLTQTSVPQVQQEKNGAADDLSAELTQLEEAKRKKLQAMLSEQALKHTVAPPAQDIDTKNADNKTVTQPQTKPDVNENQHQPVITKPVESKLPEPIDLPKQKPVEPSSPVQAPSQDVGSLEGGISPVSSQNTDTDTSQSINSVLQWAANGRPVWAQEKFDVLLFEVAGLTLAVPLIALGNIVPFDNKLTPLLGQSEWFMGILPTPLGDIKTINTALFVMPEKYKKEHKSSVKYVISIDGMSWGMAVDKVNQPVTLSPDDVKWRSQRTSRLWLAGTVKEKMCALIDIPQMAYQLNSSDKNQSHLH